MCGWANNVHIRVMHKLKSQKYQSAPYSQHVQLCLLMV